MSDTLDNKYQELMDIVNSGQATADTFAQLSQISAARAAGAVTAQTQVSPVLVDSPASKIEVTVTTGMKGTRRVDTQVDTPLGDIIVGLGLSLKDYALRLRKKSGDWVNVAPQYRLTADDVTDGKVEVLAAPNVGGGK